MTTHGLWDSQWRFLCMWQSQGRSGAEQVPLRPGGFRFGNQEHKQPRALARGKHKSTSTRVGFNPLRVKDYSPRQLLGWFIVHDLLVSPPARRSGKVVAIDSIPAKVQTDSFETLLVPRWTTPNPLPIPLLTLAAGWSIFVGVQNQTDSSPDLVGTLIAYFYSTVGRSTQCIVKGVSGNSKRHRQYQQKIIINGQL